MNRILEPPGGVAGAITGAAGVVCSAAAAICGRSVAAAPSAAAPLVITARREGLRPRPGGVVIAFSWVLRMAAVAGRTRSEGGRRLRMCACLQRQDGARIAAANLLAHDTADRCALNKAPSGCRVFVGVIDREQHVFVAEGREGCDQGNIVTLARG